MKRIAVFGLAAIVLAVSCKRREEGKTLQYYATPNPYEIVDVAMPPVDNEVRNVILMIGDGMGLEQVSCAWVLNHGKLNLDRFPSIGLSRTWCTNELITDSGAGGTALAAGQKTAYSHVGTAADSTDLASMLVKAQELGKKTGVVVTCHFADATPCDFCCHNEYRYNQDDLIADYVTCGVDYLSGGGLDWFTVNRKDNRDITREMAAAGYTVALTEEDLMAADLPVIGILAPDNLPVAMERGDLYRRTVTRGLDILSRESGDRGFVMMLEGSCIDDWLHGNDIEKAMEELLDFDRTIGDVLTWAAADGHTLVVVTADHNTGCLTLQDGNLEEGRIGVAFGSESHNGIAVPVYAWGPGSDAFTGIRENDEWGRLIASFVK
ncbi:MAG: alkaline phosphatase [Bacteroidales bacterium]|jgi:alkaline phosphatase|nr:alkaline phosphatase [Bacteroidales bacterium]